MSQKVIWIEQLKALIDDNSISIYQMQPYLKNVSKQTISKYRTGKVHFINATVKTLVDLDNVVKNINVAVIDKEKTLINIDMVKSVIFNRNIPIKLLVEFTELPESFFFNLRKGKSKFENVKLYHLFKIMQFCLAYPIYATNGNEYDFGLLFEFLSDVQEFNLLDSPNKIRVIFDESGNMIEYYLPGHESEIGDVMDILPVDQVIEILKNNEYYWTEKNEEY